GTLAVAGHNIKLGRGGIREIEFFVQTQQLIAGGRQHELRGRKTLEMLGALEDIGWIDADARTELTQAYRLLRRIENRLQMQADEQTHTLPKDDEALLRFALFCGYETSESFTQALVGEMQAVEKHYSALFEAAPGLGTETGPLVFTGADDDPATLETLHSMGFSDPAMVSRTVREWHYGRHNATRSAAARERLTELMPALIGALGQSENADYAFITFDRFLGQLPAGVQLFSLLLANPQLLSLLADVMGTSPRLARALSQRPRALEDAVLDPEFFSTLPGEAGYSELARQAVGPASDMEDALNRARTFGSEQLFRIGVRQLSGTVAADEAGAAYSGLAGGLTKALLAVAEADLAERHGKVPGGEVVVIGMGKFGSQEMTATSDLDLILIYDAPEGTEASDGPKPLAVGQFYTRLTQRLISALAAPTSEGRLFEVDMRLRPSGRSGPVATRLSAFSAYQLESAWTWEKMALTRARVIAGSAGLGERVASVIRQTLTTERDTAATAQDVAEMRDRIAAEKGSDDIWAIKTVRGGLIDIEFIAQYLQLVHAPENPEVLQTNTARALRTLAQSGALGSEAAEELREALALFHEVTQMVRLSLGDPADPRTASESFKRRLAKAVNIPDFNLLEAELAASEERVATRFDEIVGPKRQ
ncbi:MAG: bifunctional [glutamine synthetase] adenylyltransferase/[glutamine synthetase]-adenylyl-L-tyrosine phosphorylase, partial [Rhizobiales bacterium]|nr:bifunctional [glutamine synthetase] adenylyltransferase/[glutamine synthetase]-adenylyl-L-tyrosine phosphorylase [Hyphomicrobiales bacterium]